VFALGLVEGGHHKRLVIALQSLLFSLFIIWVLFL
jgi:hypothetical protein